MKAVWQLLKATATIHGQLSIKKLRERRLLNDSIRLALLKKVPVDPSHGGGLLAGAFILVERLKGRNNVAFDVEVDSTEKIPPTTKDLCGEMRWPAMLASADKS